MYLIFFICSSVDGHLSCVLAIVNSASVNTGVLVTLQILVLSGFMPSSGITESYGNSVFGFLSNFHILFSIVAAPFYIPTNSVTEYLFLHTLSNIYYL